MASQTGLSQLGDAIFRGTSDYANISLRRQQEAERRAQALADLAGARTYAEGQFDKQRGLQVADRTEGRTYAEGQAMELRNLARVDKDNARRQGINDATYALLLKDEWLLPQDADNPVKVAEAAAKRQAYADKQRANEDEARTNAIEELNQLAVDRAKLVQKDSKIDEKIRELEVQGAEIAELTQATVPTEAEIRAEAESAARAKGVDLSSKEPKRSQQLANYVGEAEKKLTLAGQMAALAAGDSLKGIRSQYQNFLREKQANTAQLQIIRQSMDGLQRQHKIAAQRAAGGPSQSLGAPAGSGFTPSQDMLDEGGGIGPGAALAPPVESAPPPRANVGMKDFTTKVREAMGGNRIPPPPPDVSPMTAAPQPRTSAGASLLAPMFRASPPVENPVSAAPPIQFGAPSANPMTMANPMTPALSKAEQLRRLLGQPLPELKPLPFQPSALVFGNEY